MKQWIANLHRIITNKNNRPGILVIVFLLLFTFAGELTNFYIRKTGIYTIGIVTFVKHAPRGGYTVDFEYSYMGSKYKKTSTFTETNINLESIGKKMVIVFLPSYPNISAVAEYPPDCIGDAPPEGWKEIPKCE